MKKLISIFLTVIISLSAISLVGCDKKVKRSSYKIDCEFDESTMSLTADMDFTYYNNTDTTISQLKFNLFGNAYRKGAKLSPISMQYEAKAYPNGKSYGDMKINSVKVYDEDVEFMIGGVDQNVLIVPLENELYPEEYVTLSIDYNLSLANICHRLGYVDKVVNLGNFYPILCGYDNGFYECAYYASGDPFYSEVADYQVDITLSNEYIVASSGVIKSISNNDLCSTHTFTLKNARDFALVLSKEFDILTANVEGVNINYYFYNDETPEESLEYAKKSVSTFNKLFGKYPYESLAVVQTKFLQGGMEYPALVYISDALEKDSYGEVIVHETAHQWWYAGVGNNQVEYAFLDEGLTEYSVVLFYENNAEYGITREDLIGVAELSYKTFCSVYDKVIGKVDTSMLRTIGEFTSEYEYVNISYMKGCLMFEYLRKSIGDAKFFKGLQKYYSTYCYKVATPSDLAGIYAKSGVDTDGYFDSWFNGKVII